ncbi:hypothetical protein [Streptomyces anulatus]|uniref:hypothetical protein n=1 Tax=Streptomyces anulatus TaxID=1892 RepID=UPI002E1018E9|nr:hypothetical protein OG274_38330 [Streptomyces anulatus]
MTVFEPTPQARAAAERAAVLAEIARRRALFVSAGDGRELLCIADLLDTVAVSFYGEEPTVGGIPDGAWLALADAEETAADAPGTGFPPEFGQYVKRAVDGGPLWTPEPIILTGCHLAADDARLTAALGVLHGHLAAAATEEVAHALLEAVLSLCEKRAHLLRVVRG